MIVCSTFPVTQELGFPCVGWTIHSLITEKMKTNVCKQGRARLFLSNLKSLNLLNFSENKRTNTNCFPLEDLLVFKLS